MNPPSDAAAHSPVKRALLALEKMQNRLDAVESARTEPIAVIGLGCRLPGGAGTPDAYWQLLRDGVDAVVEVPPSRWDVDALYDQNPEIAGKMTTRWAGFLDQVDHFDAAFFGISPREAATMDPQQRLLLEVVWEALEDAGLPPDTLSGSAGGVFMGVCGNDYARFQFGDLQHIDAYSGLGSAHSIIANRLSYSFNLQGPSLAIDTACSSSLVAVHLACQSLRSRECDLALAGGVNLILTPEVTVMFSRARLMAPDGRCKTFDARADGYVRGEGAAVVVLKRLSDAVRAGDNIVALLRGSAVNQDGRSNGLTAPNLLSQQTVQRQALANAGLEPAQVGFIETHGTGTALGDPIEVEALAAVYGAPRPAGAPCWLGAVKTNLGHLEGAAGIAGLLKVILSLRHGAIPPNLHFRQLNPNIHLAGTALALPTRLTPWPAGQQPRRAAISSFGFGGTNAHVIVEETSPAPAPGTGVERPLHVLLLSAKSPAALRALAGRYAGLLAGPPGAAPWPDVCFSANTGRMAFAHRAALVADAASAPGLLAAFAAGDQPEAVLTGTAAEGKPPKVAFLFTGQGGQFAGMGRQLYHAHASFRADVDRCAAFLRPILDCDLTGVMFAEPGSPAALLLDGPALAQPALFTLEWALARLWLSLDVRPAVLLGHSLGEITAACLAGVLSLEDALRLVAARGRLLDAAPPGAMAAVFADAPTTEALLARLAAPELIGVAALNGPAETVVAGAAAAVEAVLAECAAQGLRFKRLPAGHAYHSPLLIEASAALAREAAGLALSPARLPLASTVTGALAEPDALAAPAYWARQVMDPVRFAPALAAVVGLGVTALVEVGPHPTLLSLARQAYPEAGLLALPSLRRDGDDWRHLLSSVGRLAVAGTRLNWRALDDGQARRRVTLPTYPFQRERYWLDHAVALPPRPASAPAAALAEPSPAPPEPALFEQLLAEPAPAARQRLITGYLRRRIARALHTDAAGLGLDQHLADLGTDSLTMIDVLNDCRSQLRLVLYAREFYERPSLAELAGYVAAEFERVHGSAAQARPAGAAPAALAPAADAAASATLPSPLRGQAEPKAEALAAAAPPEVTLEENLIDVRGLRLCVCAWGPLQGPPVLCLHGMLDHGAGWERVAAFLAHRGLRVIAPDLRGHGRSGHASPGSAYHLLDMLGDIDGLLSALGERPLTLVGHSLGAVLAAVIAVARPQRVSGLVLVEPPPLPGPDGRSAVERLARQLDSLAEHPAHSVLPDVAAAAERLRHAQPALSAAWALRMAERLTEPHAGGVRWRWDPVLRSRAGLVFDGVVTQATAGDLLGRVAAPVLLVYGDRADSAASRGAPDLSLPGARRLSLPGGHALHLEAPAALADAVSSLAA